MGEPRATGWPAATDGSTGSYVVRSPPACSMLTTGRPATIPAKTTTPFPAASTGTPGAPRRWTPRCAAADGDGGAATGRVTGAAGSGRVQRGTAAAATGSAVA